LIVYPFIYILSTDLLEFKAFFLYELILKRIIRNCNQTVSLAGLKISANRLPG